MMNTECLHVLGLCSGVLRSADVLESPEKALLKQVPPEFVPSPKAVKEISLKILAGEDPIGDLFMKISPDLRRTLGAVYTPKEIVHSMTEWIRSNSTPDRIIDPGAGSGRYIIEAGRIFPKAELVAVEIDPFASIALKANLKINNLLNRCRVILKDYREIQLPEIDGKTAFIGNPPYVRHHDIDLKWKQWYINSFKEYGIKASGLSGLHLHFFLKTLQIAKDGDIGTFITSAEWLDVNYGSSLREVFFNKLGGVGLHVLSPEINAFPGTATTAAITCFKVGSKSKKFQTRHVSQLSKINGLSTGKNFAHSAFPSSAKWSVIIRNEKSPDIGGIRIGDLFRVHRGQVTGANNIWVTANNEFRLPESTLLPTITRAKELISAGSVLGDLAALKKIISLPEDFSSFTRTEIRRIKEFIQYAKEQNADSGYVAMQRRTWWSVKMKDPAPILCTYMARRPPQFTLNPLGAYNINIAHGLYPKIEMDIEEMQRYCALLNRASVYSHGRQYAGGLLKFEPREIENITLPEEIKV